MKVFISSADPDKQLARRLATGLEQAGLEVFLDEEMILPGDNWADRIAQALRESEAMVVLLTSDALRSSHVRREIEYALGEKAFKGRLIPVVVGSAADLPEESVPWILHHLRMFKLPKRGKQDESIRQIAQALLDAAA